MTENKFSPRIIFQDAFAIGMDGKLHSMMQVGLLPPKAFVIINSDEIKSKQGLDKAIDYTRKHRVPHFAELAEFTIAQGSVAETYVNMFGAVDTPKKTAELNSLLAATTPEERQKRFQEFFSERFEAIASNPRLLEDIQAQQRKLPKSPLGKSACVVLDVTKNQLIKLGFDFAERKMLTFTGKITLLFSPMIVYTALTYAGITGGSTLPPSVYVGAGVGAAAMSVTPLGRFARRLLTSHPPKQLGRERIEAQMTGILNQELSPEEQMLISQNPPIVIVASGRAYFDPISEPIHKLDRVLDLIGGIGMPSEGAIWVQTGGAKTPYLLLEEIGHQINDIVGFDAQKWSDAVAKDLKSPMGRLFIYAISNKKAHDLVYSHELLGAETLVELCAYFNRECKAGKHPEAIIQLIEGKLPETGKLFRQYKQDEAKLLAEIAGQGAEVVAHDVEDCHFSR